MVALLPPSFFSFAYWQEGGVGTSRSEVFRNLGLAAIALGALIVGSIRAWSAHRQARAANEQARIAEQGQFTERFSRAAEQLGNPALPVRLGGIYALWRLAEDSSLRDVISVIDILCAFVRDPPHRPVDRPVPDTDEGGPAAARDKANATNKLRPDVQAILDLLGGRDAPYRARLPDSHHLDLTGADLTIANLERANLRDADLSGANLSGANLSGADLWRADLSDADLAGADLKHANLSGANLLFANLTNADLTMANLMIANLTGANLTRTNLTAARHLKQEQLDRACIGKGGKPPYLLEGLEPPQKECVP